MARVLMIGAGGVATVAAFKIAQNADVFTEFMIASRRKSKNVMLLYPASMMLVTSWI